MAVANIGKVNLQVWLRKGSPFSPQPKQETWSYFDQDLFKSLTTVYKVEVLPPTIDGIRIKENIEVESNFIRDDTYDLEKVTSGSDNVEVDGRAAALFKTITTEKTFNIDRIPIYRWQITKNLFIVDPDNNPSPKQFINYNTRDSKADPTTSPASTDNSPEWTYILISDPKSKSKKILAPFMNKNSPKGKAINWGIAMLTALPKNQPFQIIYDFLGRRPSLNESGVTLVNTFDFSTPDGNNRIADLDLANTLYLACEFGKSDGPDHYLLLFISQSSPLLYSINGKAATLVAEMSGFNSSSIFDGNASRFIFSIESAGASFIVKSNAFSNPWIIKCPDLTSPYFIGEGPIVLYGGNCQAAINMTPVSYESSGYFETQPETWLTLAGNATPTCSTTMKGNGGIQGLSANQEVSLVDAEVVNDAAVVTLIQAASTQSSVPTGVLRKINISQKEVNNTTAKTDNSSGSPANPPSAAITVLNSTTDFNNNPGGNSSQVTKNFSNHVELVASDVEWGGSTIYSGRSPYIWVLRCNMQPTKGSEPADDIEISCDVMDINLTWNAVSYNEIIQSGTINVLNRKVQDPDNPKQIIHYDNYMNRAVYIRIEAWWTNGAGHDPGPGNRQIFEGLTVSAELTKRAENEIVSFKIEDYMNALEGSKFVLSPWYDGMKITLAARDIAISTGLSDNRIYADDQPVYVNGQLNVNLVGDTSLPIDPDPFRNSRYRFKTGSSFKAALVQFAKFDFKCIYFDTHGRFHFDTVPGGLLFNGPATIVEKFWTSPILAQQGGDVLDIPHLKKLAFNSFTYTRKINDVYNVIQLTTVGKSTLDKLTIATAYKAGIFNSNAEGFLGYRKHAIIIDAAYGGMSELITAMNNYASRFFLPPQSYKFEIYGYSGIKPLDKIMLDGNPIRIMNVNIKLNAKENDYKMNIEGEWLLNVGDAGKLPAGDDSNYDYNGGFVPVS